MSVYNPPQNVSPTPSSIEGEPTTAPARFTIEDYDLLLDNIDDPNVTSLIGEMDEDEYAQLQQHEKVRSRPTPGTPAFGQQAQQRKKSIEAGTLEADISIAAANEKWVKFLEEGSPSATPYSWLAAHSPAQAAKIKEKAAEQGLREGSFFVPIIPLDKKGSDVLNPHWRIKNFGTNFTRSAYNLTMGFPAELVDLTQGSIRKWLAGDVRGGYEDAVEVGEIGKGMLEGIADITHATVRYVFEPFVNAWTLNARTLYEPGKKQEYHGEELLNYAEQDFFGTAAVLLITGKGGMRLAPKSRMKLLQQMIEVRKEANPYAPPISDIPELARKYNDNYLRAVEDLKIRENKAAVEVDQAAEGIKAKLEAERRATEPTAQEAVTEQVTLDPSRLVEQPKPTERPLERADEPRIAGQHPIAALYDELQLIFPDRTRGEIRAWHKELGTDEMIRTVAAVRARIGRATVPIDHPQGSYLTSDYNRLALLGDRVRRRALAEEAARAAERDTATLLEQREAGKPELGRKTAAEEKVPIPTLHEAMRAKPTKATRVISEDAYQKAKKNFKNVGKDTAGAFDLSPAGDLATMAAYHLENMARKGVTSFAEFKQRMLGEGAKLGDADLITLWNQADKSRAPTPPTKPTEVAADVERMPPSIDFTPKEVPAITPIDQALGLSASDRVRTSLAAHFTRESGKPVENNSLRVTAAMLAWDWRNWGRGKTGKKWGDWTRPMDSPAMRKYPSEASLLVEMAASAKTAFLDTLITRERIETIYGTREGQKTLPRKSISVMAKMNELGEFIIHEAGEAVRSKQQGLQFEWQTKRDAAAIKQGEGGKLTKAEVEILAEEPPQLEGSNYPRMPDERVAKFLADEQHQAVLDVWREEINKLAERDNEAAGVETELHSPNDIYAKMSYVDDSKGITGGVITVVDTPAEPTGGKLGRARRMPKGKSGVKARSALERKGFVPKGRLLQTDAGQILFDTIFDKHDAATRRRAQDALIAIDQSIRDSMPKGEPVRGQIIRHRGQRSKLAEVYIERSGADRNIFYVPEELANLYNAVTSKPDRTWRLAAIDTWKTAIIASSLAVPAEASIHMLGALYAATTVSNWGKHGLKSRPGAVQFAYNYTPIIGRISGIMDMIIQSAKDPTFDARIRRDVAGHRVTHYDYEIILRDDLKSRMLERGKKIKGKVINITDYIVEHGADAAEGVFGKEAVGAARTAGKAVKEKALAPIGKGVLAVGKGAAVVAHLPKNIVFGKAEFGKWWTGFETRLRQVYIDQLIADMGTTAPEAVNILNNRIGNYTAKLDSKLSRMMQAVDPFARAGSALIKTGIGSAMNTAALPVYMAEAAVRKAKGKSAMKGGWVEKNVGVGDMKASINKVTTLITLTTLAMWLDSMREEERTAMRDGEWITLKKGEWRGFWEIPNLQLGGVRVPIGIDDRGKERTRELNLRYFANDVHRGLQVFQPLYQRFFLGADTKEDMVDSIGLGVTNMITSRLGPPVKALHTLGFGNTMWRGSPEGQGFPLYFDDPSKARYTQQLESAVRGIVPVEHKRHEMYGEDRFKQEQTENETLRGIEYFFKIFGFDFPIRTDEYEARQMAKIPKEKSRRRSSNLSGLALRAIKKPDDEQAEYITKKLDEFYPNTLDRAMAEGEFWEFYIRHLQKQPVDDLIKRYEFEALRRFKPEPLE